MTGLLFVLTSLQLVLIGFGKPPDGIPAIGALHPVNAMLIFSLAGFVAWRSWALAGRVRSGSGRQSAVAIGGRSEVQP